MIPQNPDQAKRFQELLGHLIDDELSTATRSELFALIRQNEAFEQAYLEHCALHAELEWEHGSLHGGLDFEEKREVGSLRFPPLARYAGIAASVALILALAWHYAAVGLEKRSWLARPALGVIEEVLGSPLQLHDAKLQLQSGDSLRKGIYQFENGIASLTLGNGVEVVIEAPAKFSIESEMLLRLYSGKASANVSSTGIGFTIETPDAEVVDYGTIFSVEVQPESASEVHVFEGEVEVKPIADRQASIRLFTDQATRIEKGSDEPAGIEIDPTRFLRSFKEPNFSYARLIRKAKPLVYYRMVVNKESLSLLDKSGHEHHGIIHQKPDLKASPFAAGYHGAALRLRRNRELFGAYPHALQLEQNTFTVTAWVKTSARPRWATLLETGRKGAPGILQIGLHKDEGTLYASLGDKHQGKFTAIESEPLPLDAWQHVALTADGTSLRLYRNGVEVASAACSGLDPLLFEQLTIGAMPADEVPAVRYWNGYIDEFALFQQALSPEQIETLAAIPPQERPSKPENPET